MTDRRRRAGEAGRAGPDPRFPDPRPFRRIQLATAALLVVAALITLTSDSRPAAVRWGSLVGVAALIVAIWLVTRRRRDASGPAPPKSLD